MEEMLDKIKKIEEKYTELGEILSKPEVIQDYNKFRDLSKQRKSMEETVELYHQWQEAKKAIDDGEEMLHGETDEEMRGFLKAEIAENEKKIEEYSEKMKVLLLPRDPMDDKDIMLEIRGSAGGDEANIFAGDLMRMYMRYADKMGWKTEVLSKTESEMGGVSEVIISVKGDSIYRRLKYESGVHRVQRVPETESQGRVHTSTATVAVMPEAEEVDVEINEKDIRIDVMRASGNGGQCVNTTDSAVRLTHYPTGIVIYSQTEKSQLQNKNKAFALLRAKLYDLKLQEQQAKEKDERLSQIGTGDRSEKIRTYNFPQGRVTDHRIGLTVYRLDDVMNGDLTEILDALIAADQAKKLAKLNEAG